jgi:hypothetical protein
MPSDYGYKYFRYCIAATAAFDGSACTAIPKLKRHSPQKAFTASPLWFPDKGYRAEELRLLYLIFFPRF